MGADGRPRPVASAFPREAAPSVQQSSNSACYLVALAVGLLFVGIYGAAYEQTVQAGAPTRGRQRLLPLAARPVFKTSDRLKLESNSPQPLQQSARALGGGGGGVGRGAGIGEGGLAHAAEVAHLRGGGGAPAAVLSRGPAGSEARLRAIPGLTAEAKEEEEDGGGGGKAAAEGLGSGAAQQRMRIRGLVHSGASPLSASAQARLESGHARGDYEPVAELARLHGEKVPKPPAPESVSEAARRQNQKDATTGRQDVGGLSGRGARPRNEPAKQVERRVDAHIHSFIHSFYIHACMHACIHTCMHACMHTYIHAIHSRSNKGRMALTR